VPDEIVLSEKKTEDKTEKKEASQEKEASQAPTETVETDKMDVDGSGEVTAEIKTETAASTPLPTDTIVANQSATQIDIGESITATHPLLVVSTQPVHSWQYDELVFSDPPSAFFDILNEHPATPLPAKLRRPRDQREIDEGPKKKSKGRASTSGVVSRAQTQEPAGTPAPAPASTRPPVGSVGESASADVPLEFAKEMEIGEHNRLTDLKITIIEQMDKLRSVYFCRCWKMKTLLTRIIGHA
jgi:YEATS domain-containing protein 4